MGTEEVENGREGEEEEDFAPELDRSVESCDSWTVGRELALCRKLYIVKYIIEAFAF